MISGPFRKLHFAGWILSTIINTLIVLSDVKLHRMYLLIAVLVLQHATLLFFMLDYEALGREQWKKKEEALRKQFAEQQRAAPIQ